MKANNDKSHLLIFGNKKAIGNITKNCIESADIHDLLGITTIDLELKLGNHINKLCKN